MAGSFLLLVEVSVQKSALFNSYRPKMYIKPEQKPNFQLYNPADRQEKLAKLIPST
jgi:hypothetical protein